MSKLEVVLWAIVGETVRTIYHINKIRPNFSDQLFVIKICLGSFIQDYKDCSNIKIRNRLCFCVYMCVCMCLFEHLPL